eukprot:scaffold40965_cov45-Phaeocystis_antarctica.AAC.2
MPLAISINKAKFNKSTKVARVNSPLRNLTTSSWCREPISSRFRSRLVTPYFLAQPPSFDAVVSSSLRLAVQ